MQEEYNTMAHSKELGCATLSKEIVNGDGNHNVNTNSAISDSNKDSRDQLAEVPHPSHMDRPTLALPTHNAMQLVNTLEEANALVKRVRQLERENSMLAAALTKVCDENAKLTSHMARQEEKCASLASAPLSSSSVLKSLFEPDKTGWFGGSKSAARENLEKLVEDLQNEFVQYQASHASSNDEVQALISELQGAHINAQNLSAILNEQQEVISRGPLAVTVHIVSGETEAENIFLSDLRRELERRDEREAELRHELRCAREELKAKAIENSWHVQELQSFRSDGNSMLEVEQQRISDEIARLVTEVGELQRALATEENLHKLKVNENIRLMQRIEELEQQLREVSLNKVEAPYEKSSFPPVSIQRYNELQQECDNANKRAHAANRTIQELETRIKEVQMVNEQQVNTLQLTIAELEQKLSQSVPQSALKETQAENKRLSQELELTSMHAKHTEDWLVRERVKKSSGNGNNNEDSFSALDDEKIIETLERNRERIARLEFQRNQLIEEAKQLREAAIAKEEELTRVTRSTQEDKQRINFLLKRCVTMTDDLNRITAARDALNEECECAQLELKRLRRQGEELVVLNQRIDELKQKNDAMQARLSGVEELENKLVKAKETIAYMELAQSRTINMSQYAELKSRNTKLENTLEPIQKQLEEARKELERVKTENESLHAVMTRQQNTIKSQEEKEAALQSNENRFREKVSQLSSENARLRDVNDTLEKQMTNMQDGIKEMAVKLEQERSKALAAAESMYKRELSQLQSKLEAANATLENVRSAQNAFVPEGIHKAILAEKERGDAEIKQKTFELDKLKSEILIYRQTIEDLESENEEHVRQIELLQTEHQKERGAAAERLGADLKKLSEASMELDQLRSQVRELRRREEELLAQEKVMEEAAQKHRRAFEDKCRQEEKLLATVAATSQEMEEQREELNRARILAEQYLRQNKKLESEVASGKAEGMLKHQQMETECNNYREELQRMSAEKEAIELELTKLRCVTKDSNIHNNNNSNDNKNNGNSTGDLTSADGMSLDAAAHYAHAEQLLMSLTQTQRQLEEQKQHNMEAAETYSKALDIANAEADALRQRVRQLESDLDKQMKGVNNSLGSTPVRMRKKKSSKKTLSSMAQLDDLQTTDILRVTAVEGGAEQQQRNVMLKELEHNISILRDENAELKEKIVVLQQELQDAYNDLEVATRDADEKTSELQEQISFLEARLRVISNDVRGDMHSLPYPMRNPRPQTEVKSLTGSLGGEEEKLNAVIHRLQLEVQTLAKELVPTKNKLVEYMAMADRLGIQYPFTADMEGAAVLRLKAIHFDSITGRTRARSAPRQPCVSLRGWTAPLVESEKKKKKKKRRHRSESQTDEMVDLR